MNLSLTPVMEQWIAEKVQEGHYQTASEVVRALIRTAMENESKTQELRRLLREGEADVQAGRLSEFNPKTLKQSIHEGWARKSKKTVRKIG
jgi:putative addiction module CopG family antidote